MLQDMQDDYGIWVKGCDVIVLSFHVALIILFLNHFQECQSLGQSPKWKKKNPNYVIFKLEPPGLDN